MNINIRVVFFCFVSSRVGLVGGGNKGYWLVMYFLNDGKDWMGSNRMVRI